MNKGIISNLKEKLSAEQPLKEEIYQGAFMMCMVLFMTILIFALLTFNYHIETHEPIDPLLKTFWLAVALLFIFLTIAMAITIGYKIKTLKCEAISPT